MEADPQSGIQADPPGGKDGADGREASDTPPREKSANELFRVGILAAVSALAGGLAVAWYYRSTLAHLRQAEDLQEVERPAAPRSGDGEGI